MVSGEILIFRCKLTIAVLTALAHKKFLIPGQSGFRSLWFSNLVSFSLVPKAHALFVLIEKHVSGL